MKCLTIYFFLIPFYIGFSQEIISPKLASENIQLILNDDNISYEPQIYVADIETIDSIIKLSKKKYKIVYFLSATCHSSIVVFPVLKEFVSKYAEVFELIPLIGHRYSEIPDFRDYLNQLTYFEPVFIMDTQKYGNRRNPSYRRHLLTQKLCGTCEDSKMGFSSFFVFDENNKIVLHNNWDVVGLDKIEQLKLLPLN